MRELEGRRRARARAPICVQLRRYVREPLAGRRRHRRRGVGSSYGDPGVGCGSDGALQLLPFPRRRVLGDDGGLPENHRCRNPEYLQSRKQPAQASEKHKEIN